jgi:hypothetical protein
MKARYLKDFEREARRLKERLVSDIKMSLGYRSSASRSRSHSQGQSHSRSRSTRKTPWFEQFRAGRPHE